MYKCKKCGGILTDFDVCFGKNLLDDYQVDNCNCYRCQIGEDGLKVFEKAKIYKQNLIIYLCIFGTILAGVLIIMLSSLLSDWKLLGSILQSFGIKLDVYTLMDVGKSLTSGLIVPLFLLFVIVFFYCDHLIIHQWHKEFEGGYTGKSHYEAKIDSNGNITAKKVDDYIMNSDNSGMQTIRFITFPLWFIFHFIYVLIQSVVYLKIKIPTKAIRAYKFASKQVPKYTVTPQEIAQHKTIIEKHKKKTEKIIKKNTVLGQDEVNRHLAKVGVPVKCTTLNKKRCICVEETQHYGYYSRDKRYIRFILSKRSDEEIKYNTLFGTYDAMYPVYGAEDSLDFWKAMGISQTALSDLPELTSKLNVLSKYSSNRVVTFN